MRGKDGFHDLVVSHQAEQARTREITLRIDGKPKTEQAQTREMWLSKSRINTLEQAQTRGMNAKVLGLPNLDSEQAPNRGIDPSPNLFSTKNRE